MGSAVRTRSGPGCLWHASPMGNRTHNLGVLSIGFMLLPVLTSTGSGISAWFMLWFRDQLFVHHLQWNQGLSEFLFPLGFEPCPPDFNCNWLKGVGTTVWKYSQHPTWSRPTFFKEWQKWFCGSPASANPEVEKSRNIVILLSVLSRPSYWIHL